MNNVLICISAGIAAYKVPELIRLFKKDGNAVKVVLSQNASEFVTSTTLQAVSQEAPYLYDSDPRCSTGMAHIELAKWADVILIAPLTANRLAALAHGFADDLITTTCLASTAPIYIAPAMNKVMWQNMAVQRNLAILRERGFSVVGPDEGEQACGDVGFGRMSSPEAIYHAVIKRPQGITQGKKLLITAGPTQEAIDPVRYISNRSSGKMGYAIARAAHAMGYQVHLVSGPVSLSPPDGIKVTKVKSAVEMLDVVMTNIAEVDIFVAAAAVADFRVKAFEQKLTKSEFYQQGISFIPNPDILLEVGKLAQKPFTVGFAAQTHDGPQYAKAKQIKKRCDLMALNEVQHEDIGFESDDNALTVFSMQRQWHLPKQNKQEIAFSLMDIIGEQFNAKHQLKDS